MNKLFYTLTIISLALYGRAQAQVTPLSPPAGSAAFGTIVTVLPNGNYVVTDRSYGGGTGAAYLYNGQTNTVISTLTGVKDATVTVLTNGNFVIRSPFATLGNSLEAGAVTWGSATTGVSGVVSAANSLVGSQFEDRVGIGVNALPNGNYVVTSFYWDNGNLGNAGAITWGNGATGTSGVVGASNSLVGGGAGTSIGFSGIVILNNSNYVADNHLWSNNIGQSGAVTWCSGTAATTGFVSASNSLVGSFPGGQVGSGGITALPNGNYIIKTDDWNNGGIFGAGAVTWGNGTAGTSGVVSAANSLVGSSTNDKIGNNGILVLPNSNYLVSSPLWDNGSATDAGALTWGSGTAGISGAVSAANSLVGSSTNDQVGIDGIVTLTNGNYVVHTNFWDNGSIANAGAATWGNGTTGIAGTISATNSLVGTTTSDRVGGSGITALTNGHYVVNSRSWSNGSATAAGASTWCNGTTGRTGPVTPANSLVGSQSYDDVGTDTAAALSNGNYVVTSIGWNNGTIVNTGAVTWCNGATGRTGIVSTANSLVGSSTNDFVGLGGVKALANGNYVALSHQWKNGTATNAGAATWGNGTTGTVGTVGAGNSLIGGNKDDKVGDQGITALPNGNYLVGSYRWRNGSAYGAGAVTWGNGATGISGLINAGNSLVGSASGDAVGGGSASEKGVIVLSNGNYVVSSPEWRNGTLEAAGAVTWGSAATGISGVLSAANSLVGDSAKDYIGSGFQAYGNQIKTLSDGNYIVYSPAWNNGSVLEAGAVTLGNGTVGTTGLLSNCNSILGTQQQRGLDFVFDYSPLTGKLIVGKSSENKAAVISAAQQLGIALTNSNATKSAAGLAVVSFTNNDCKLIAALKPTGTNRVKGSIEARVYLETSTPTTSTGEKFCRRYYALLPADSASVKTARITLYFTQAEFDDYNNNNGISTKLPASPNDAGGKTDLRITQQRGTSATGAFNSFTGFGGSGSANVLIVPGDSNVIWNASLSHWEVSFEVTGFGGFFLSAGNDAPLALPATGAFKNNRASVSPVPASSTVTITNNNLQLAGSTVTALNLQGQLMATAILESNTKMEVQNWPAGIYLLKFADGSVLKMVKQ